GRNVANGRPGLPLPVIQPVAEALERRRQFASGAVSPAEVIEWALERFGRWRLVVTTGFGMEGCALIDMIARAGGRVQVVAVDTGFLFAGTHDLRRRLAERYPRMDFVVVRPELSPAEQASRHGPELWRTDPAACCRMRKVEPMHRALAGADVWFTALRRDQSETRAGLQLVEWDWQWELIKVNPLAHWTRRQVWAYVQEHDVPHHALHHQGYPTIGCTHCTTPVDGSAVDDYSREGRWVGSPRTECGLHDGVRAARGGGAGGDGRATPSGHGSVAANGNGNGTANGNGVANGNGTVNGNGAVRHHGPARSRPESDDCEPVAPAVDRRPEAAAPSKAERAKLASDHLRGGIARTLADDSAERFDEADALALKFHGIYQQDDRDERRRRRAAGAGKAFSFMLRVRLPGGILTPEQYLVIDELAERYASGSVRLTTRQSVQLHGVLKGDLRRTIAGINRTLLTTLSACGDVARNVMACPAPFSDEAHRAVGTLARELADALMPGTGAYHEIWLDGERLVSAEPEEPFYGAAYLPRKFKLGVTLDGDNAIDAYAYDAALIGLTAAGDGRSAVLGYNLLVGGGLGMTHNRPETIARLATPIAFVAPERAVEVVRAVAATFRDHGNRADRRQARLKYLLESWGPSRFRRALERRLGWSLADPRPMPAPRQLDHLGRHDQGDGRLFYGVFVPSGRVVDVPGGPRYRSALRRIVRTLRPGVRLTPMQSVLFTDLEPADVDRILAVLAEHDVPVVERLSSARRWSMACPALPTCGLALADAERALPGVVAELEKRLEVLGLGEVPLTVRMTGCPNGCARPYNADIGLVGRKPGVYHVYVGGGLGGDRLADLYAADVSQEHIVAVLAPLLARFAAERRGGEGLGDFHQRLQGRTEARTVLTGREAPIVAAPEQEVRR
ncbi:MAG: NADPH-dependent assimilatory sulfite reductase hemoprotein subunit, partial [Planctomycetota bacterium]